jgi:hypothetical protein
MTLLRSFWFSALIVVIVCSCAPPPVPSDVSAAASDIRRYLNAFEGLSPDEVRARLSGVDLVEEEWSEEGLSGRQLVATFAEYEIRFLFFQEKVITTSLQILSQ